MSTCEQLGLPIPDFNTLELIGEPCCLRSTCARPSEPQPTDGKAAVSNVFIGACSRRDPFSTVVENVGTLL